MKEIFVFESNLTGRHGKGAALYAKHHHGAITGQGTGLQGNSYAIPTKDKNIKTLPLKVIEDYVMIFKVYAEIHTDLVFNVTPIGCGLAGYAFADIAPFFKNSPKNVVLPTEFKELL